MTLCPSTRFVDGSIPVLTHDPLLLIVLLRYEQDPDREILVLLGEIGGIEEQGHRPCQERKFIVVWAIGSYNRVEFVHAGKPGFVVLDTVKNSRERECLVKTSVVDPKKEWDPPAICTSGVKLGLIRKPAALILTISDERGQELLYADMRTSDVVKEDIGVLHMKRKHTCPTVLRSNWFRGQL
ncbi:hypothetical protein M378DRAFT_15562 [Amanita muscaria Koide BX008]|uniref:Uncharacterized protein n=1 Tax=Amanita muscaria (strain Koide BX008) TaxID=946122 RepID=A0A0C2WP30_AMAMK|nr:hypothetical protein M378DRAFT_15562 [Amanita muscaria Koide BX008]